MLSQPINNIRESIRSPFLQIAFNTMNVKNKGTVYIKPNRQSYNVPIINA